MHALWLALMVSACVGEIDQTGVDAAFLAERALQVEVVIEWPQDACRCGAHVRLVLERASGVSQHGRARCTDGVWMTTVPMWQSLRVWAAVDDRPWLDQGRLDIVEPQVRWTLPVGWSC